MVASAPRSLNVLNTCSLRPAATTRPAPRCLAIWMASLPATPVAPRTRTVSPRLSCARQTSESQADKAGFGRAAAVASLTPSGIGKHQDRNTTVRSAIIPYGGRDPPQNTRVHRQGCRLHHFHIPPAVHDG